MLLQPTNSCKPQHIYLVGLVPCRAGLQRKTTQEENHAGSSWETKGEAAGSMYRLTDFKESNLSSSGARTCACIAFAAFLLTGALFFGGSSSSASTGDGCSGEPEVVDEVLEGTPCADVSLRLKVSLRSKVAAAMTPSLLEMGSWKFPEAQAATF